jgi:hypothetical protein
MLYCNLWPVWLCLFFLPHHLISGLIFRKKVTEHKTMFWLSIQLLSQTFLILRRIEGNALINVYTSSCKIRVILIDFNENRIFLTDFRSVLKYQIS